MLEVTHVNLYKPDDLPIEFTISTQSKVNRVNGYDVYALEVKEKQKWSTNKYLHSSIYRTKATIKW